MFDKTVIIAGGGASGALVAVNLMRRTDNVRAIVVEPRDVVGRGVAYSTTCAAHLLNVPAAKMSAFPDQPADFVEWLTARGELDAGVNAFVPRRTFGAYLEDTVTRARQAAGDRFVHVRAQCTHVEVTDNDVTVTCSDGESLRGEAFVLAAGNAAPARWKNAPHSDRFFASAWDEHALVPSDPDEVVLILGTGLTAVDAVLGLRENGHRGQIYMVSRRGLLPHEHRLFDAPPAANPEAEHVSDLRSAMRHLVKDAAKSRNWRSSIDAMRARTNTVWREMTLEEQRRFVRHAMPYWNVHRHRMAPEVAKTLGDLIASDTLRMVAGRTGTMTESPTGLHVPIRLRSEEDVISLDAGRVINCSGPQHDFSKLGNPLIADLMRQKLLNPHPLGIGVDVSERGALRDRDGEDATRLFAIGPIRYGTLIETTAIPEIRAQALELVSVLGATLLETAR